MLTRSLILGYMSYLSMANLLINTKSNMQEGMDEIPCEVKSRMAQSKKTL